MPKMKTHKGTQRRIHITAAGKLMRAKGGKSHFRRRKARRVKGQFDEMWPVSRADQKRVRRLLPYGV